MPLDSIYSSISPSPIAAASLGQVYKARLKSTGQIVAVKIQRPGIEEAIGLDFFLLRGLGSLINKYVDIITSDVVALIDEFARRVYQELNYVQVRTFVSFSFFCGGLSPYSSTSVQMVLPIVVGHLFFLLSRWGSLSLS